MRKRTFTEEQEKEIINLYNNKFSSVEISKKYNRSPSTICTVLRRNNVKMRNNKQNNRKYYINHDFFEEINTEEKAYWLGFIYADGYVTSKNHLGVVLSHKDKKYLFKLRKSLESNYPIHDYIPKKNSFNTGKYSRLLVTSDKIKLDLVKQGVVENKTNILKPPVIKEELHGHFIRGYFDGDGSLTATLRKRKTTNDYMDYAVKILGTEEILDFIKEYIEKNGIAKINKYHKRKEDQVVSSLELTGNKQVEKFLDMIYKDSTIYLERKYKRYNKLKHNTNSPA